MTSSKTGKPSRRTPLANSLVGSVPSLTLAGLLYARSGLAMALMLAGRRLWRLRECAISLPRRGDAWILFRGQALPSLGVLCLAMAGGFLGYGDSLVLFVLALRYLGTARAGAYFSVAPIFGAALAVLIHHTHINYRAALATAVSSGVDFGLCTVLRIRMSGGNRFLPP